MAPARPSAHVEVSPLAEGVSAQFQCRSPAERALPGTGPANTRHSAFRPALRPPAVPAAVRFRYPHVTNGVGRVCPFRARSGHPAPLRNVLRERRQPYADASFVELLRIGDRPRDTLVVPAVAYLRAVRLWPALFIATRSVRYAAWRAGASPAATARSSSSRNNRWLSSW